jgi:acyl transferase domain-containing protein
MLADNARQLDLPNRPFQRRRDSLCADHHVVVAHDADPEI